MWINPPRRTPGNVSVDAPLLGNGDLAVTFAGPLEHQQFYITRNDFWKLKSQYGKSGPRPLATEAAAAMKLIGAEDARS